MFSAANDILPPLMSSLRPTPPPRPQHPNETPRDGRIRAPCMIRGVSAAKRTPPWQDLRAMHSQKAICRAFRIHGAHILPGRGAFPVRGPFWDAWDEKLATDCRPGTHQGEILPSPGAWDRIAAKYCHGLPPGNAPWRHGAGKHRANETSANSTTCDDASKKP